MYERFFGSKRLLLSYLAVSSQTCHLPVQMSTTPLAAPTQTHQQLKSLFKQSDDRGIECLALLFGNGFALADVCVPDHRATETSCSLTEGGMIQLAEWARAHPEKVLMAWAHSHHGLSIVPSVVDVETQYKYQSKDHGKHMVMIILNLEGQMRCWRLSRAAMNELSKGNGRPQEGTDTMTLLEEVAIQPIEGQLVKHGVELVDDIQPIEGQLVNNVVELVDDDGECRRCAGLSQKLVRVQTKLHVFARRLKLAKRACQMQQSRPSPLNLLFTQRMAALEARVQALEGQAAVRPRMPPSAFALFKASISAELAGFRGLRAQTQEASRRWRALPGAHKRPFEEVHQAKREAYHAQLRARAARDE